MNKLIQAIEEAGMFTEEGDRVLYEQQIIDLINTHMAGKVIVPADDFKELINIAIWRQDSREDREQLIARCQAIGETQ